MMEEEVEDEDEERGVVGLPALRMITSGEEENAECEGVECVDEGL